MYVHEETMLAIGAGVSIILFAIMVVSSVWFICTDNNGQMSKQIDWVSVANWANPLVIGVLLLILFTAK